MDLNGKHAIITGGFGGIGYAVGKQLLANGVKCLAIFDIQENVKILAEFRKNFPQAKILFFKTDVAEKLQLTESYRRTVEEFKTVELVINCSGIVSELEVEKCVGVNLTGVINSSLIAFEYMSKEKGGNGGIVVNISSVSGLQPSAGVPVYAATKHGVLGFTRSLSDPEYYKKSGIGFLTICPGFTDTDFLKSLDGFNKNYPIEKTAHYPSIKRQTPEQCADRILDAIKLAKNGSVWLIDFGKMIELNLPNYFVPTY